MRCGEIWAENVAPAPNTKGRNHWRQEKKGKNGKCDKCGEKLTTKVAVDVHDRTSCGKGQRDIINNYERVWTVGKIRLAYIQNTTQQ